MGDNQSMSTHHTEPRLAPPVAEISREEVVRRLRDPSWVLLNVLPKEAFEEARIPGSLNLPVAEVTQRARQVIPDIAQEVAVYCGGFT